MQKFTSNFIIAYFSSCRKKKITFLIKNVFISKMFYFDTVVIIDFLALKVGLEGLVKTGYFFGSVQSFEGLLAAFAEIGRAAIGSGLDSSSCFSSRDVC